MRRRIVRVLLALLAIVVLLALGGLWFGACILRAPTYQGPPSDHFDGKKFTTDGKVREQGFGAFFKWQMSRERGVWPEWIDDNPGSPPPKVVGASEAERGRARITFINHATTLIQLDGVNVLTDPTWAERASPVKFAGPKRVRAPGIRFEDLPRIDAIVLSHNHYDHMDVDTLIRLRDANDPDPLVIAGLGNDLFLREIGLTRVKAVDWGDVVDLENTAVKIHSVKNQHFSNRGIGDQDGTLWSAYVIEGPTAGRVYFAGDTGYGAHFAEAAKQHGPLRAAILPIGAYKPEWFMGFVHTTPAEAVKAMRDLRAPVAIGIHWGTFNLADEGYDDPVRDLDAALDEAELRTGWRPAFWALRFGEGRDLP